MTSDVFGVLVLISAGGLPTYHNCKNFIDCKFLFLTLIIFSPFAEILVPSTIRS